MVWASSKLYKNIKDNREHFLLNFYVSKRRSKLYIYSFHIITYTSGTLQKKKKTFHSTLLIQLQPISIQWRQNVF